MNTNKSITDLIMRRRYLRCQARQINTVKDLVGFLWIDSIVLGTWLVKVSKSLPPLRLLCVS